MVALTGLESLEKEKCAGKINLSSLRMTLRIVSSSGISLGMALNFCFTFFYLGHMNIKTAIRIGRI